MMFRCTGHDLKQSGAITTSSVNGPVNLVIPHVLVPLWV